MPPIDLGLLFGPIADAVGAVAGWTFEKVTDGLFKWLAKALVLMVEWVWQVLDRASRPHVLEPWFANDLVGRLAPLSLAIVVAMMLANGISAGFAGRPELVADTLREAVAAVFSTAVALTVVDALLQFVEDASAYVWQLGRADLLTSVEAWLKVSTAPAFGQTFVGPLGALLGIVGVVVCAVVLFMRSTLIYVVAAVFPIVRATAVLPMFRGSTRKLVHLGVALILAPFVITLTLVVAVKLMGNADVSNGDPVAAIGTILSGFLAFTVAGVSPWVLYRVMPTVEGAMAGTGVVAGWGRSAMTGVQAATMAKTAGASRALSAASRPVGAASSVGGGLDGATASTVITRRYDGRQATAPAVARLSGAAAPRSAGGTSDRSREPDQEGGPAVAAPRPSASGQSAPIAPPDGA